MEKFTEIINYIYNSQYFIIALFAIIGILLIVFIAVLISGKKKTKKDVKVEEVNYITPTVEQVTPTVTPVVAPTEPTETISMKPTIEEQPSQVTIENVPIEPTPIQELNSAVITPIEETPIAEPINNTFESSVSEPVNNTFESVTPEPQHDFVFDAPSEKETTESTPLTNMFDNSTFEEVKPAEPVKENDDSIYTPSSNLEYTTRIQMPNQFSSVYVDETPKTPVEPAHVEPAVDESTPTENIFDLPKPAAAPVESKPVEESPINVEPEKYAINNDIPAPSVAPATPDSEPTTTFSFDNKEL